jgi:hypothetical protein
VPMGRYSWVPCAQATPPARSIHNANPMKNSLPCAIISE